MENQPKDDKDQKMAASAAARPAAKNLNRGKVPDPLNDTETGDPFIRDMQNIADDSALDGNAQINSPQVNADEEGSPGTSR